MIPRFEATNFSGITPEMIKSYKENGILVLDNLVSAEDCDKLRARMDELVAGFDPHEHNSIFSSKNKTQEQDNYFLDSGHDIRFFFEEEAFDENGQLSQTPEKSLNKVGHALHDLDPVFDSFCRQPRLKAVAKGLGQSDPLLLQSMYIFKQPEIGGEVVCHQDATYLRTDPETCIGMWVAIEDATVENGCLWGIPGGHKGDSPKTVLKRDDINGGTFFETLDETPFEEDKKVPLPAPKGTVLIFSGLFPHMSNANRSAKSRHAFTLHVIDKEAHYPADNWLKRPSELPLRGF